MHDLCNFARQQNHIQSINLYLIHTYLNVLSWSPMVIHPMFSIQQQVYQRYYQVHYNHQYSPVRQIYEEIGECGWLCYEAGYKYKT